MEVFSHVDTVDQQHLMLPLFLPVAASMHKAGCHLYGNWMNYEIAFDFTRMALSLLLLCEYVLHSVLINTAAFICCNFNINQMLTSMPTFGRHVFC